MWRQLEIFFIFIIVSVATATRTQTPALTCTGEHVVYDPCPRGRQIYCDELVNGKACNNNGPCKPTCRCADGYLMNNDRCIKIADCFRCRGPNEYFNCASGCDRRCSDLSILCNGGYDVCIEMCYCREGYARDDHGICVLIKDCKCSKCKDPNAEYSTCKHCAVSCDDREPVCTGECVAGCSCKYGYVRTSKKDDTCIKESRCPKDPRCPCKNQYYTSCADQCPERCPDRNGTSTCPPPTTSCQPGCQCIAGYVLTDKGCILPSKCPPFICDAHPNEVYSKCGEKCTPSCSSVLNQDPPSCKFVDRCYPECLCKKGYVRDGSGTCVPQKKCCSCKCPNEEYLECGPFCEATCQNQNPTCSCTSCKSGCFCKLGYIRNDGKCVSLADCAVPATAQT